MNGDLRHPDRPQAGDAAAGSASDGAAPMLRVPHRSRDRRRGGGSRLSASWQFASSLDEERPLVTLEPVSRVILDGLHMQAEKTREVSEGIQLGHL